MSIYDTHCVSKEAARQVEAALRAQRDPEWAEAHPDEVPTLTGPLKRLAAALASMAGRADRYSHMWVGTSRVQPIKDNACPISGRPLFEEEGRHGFAPVIWESTGGLFSGRAWHLAANLHIEVSEYYGDTHVSLTDVELRVAGHAGNTLYKDDGGLGRLAVVPLRQALARQGMRELVGIDIPTADPLPEMDHREWFITIDHASAAWQRGFGIAGEETPRSWLNASPYDITLLDGTELEAAESPAWVTMRTTTSPRPKDLPAPVPGQAVIVTEAVALLSPHRRDLVYPPPVGLTLTDRRGESHPIKAIHRY